MAWSRRALNRVPGIGFHKMLGSGTGEGFTPYPNWSVYAILATWPDRETADQQLSHSPVFQRYRDRAVESWTVFLTSRSVRGAWDGISPFVLEEGDTRPEPIAVLTRATLKVPTVLAFWKHVPGIEAVLPNETENLLFKIGLGEVPWFHQVTFSIWRTAAAMEAFAYSGPHQSAAKDALAKGWFKEDLFARFAVAGSSGGWEASDPLAVITPRSSKIDQMPEHAG